MKKHDEKKGAAHSKDNGIVHDEVKTPEPVSADLNINESSGVENGFSSEGELISKMNEEVGILKKEIDLLKDTMLRRQADFENYKKRSCKQQDDQKRVMVANIARDVIKINDDLLMAIDASSTLNGDSTCSAAHAAIVEGVSMISRQIEDMLRKYGVEEVELLGKPFDPICSEAVEIEMSPEVETDTIVKVYRKGFRIEDLTVRSAMVKVAKPQKPEVKAASSENSEEKQTENA